MLWIPQHKKNQTDRPLLYFHLKVKMVKTLDSKFSNKYWSRLWGARCGEPDGMSTGQDCLVYDVENRMECVLVKIVGWREPGGMSTGQDCGLYGVESRRECVLVKIAGCTVWRAGWNAYWSRLWTVRCGEPDGMSTDQDWGVHGVESRMEWVLIKIEGCGEPDGMSTDQNWGVWWARFNFSKWIYYNFIVSTCCEQKSK